MDRPSYSEHVVKQGVFLYAGSITCDIRIVLSPMRLGSGDPDDLPDVCSDIEAPTFYVQFGSTTERGVYTAGSQGHSTIDEALLAVANTPGVGSTVRWETT